MGFFSKLKKAPVATADVAAPVPAPVAAPEPVIAVPVIEKPVALTPAKGVMAGTRQVSSETVPKVAVTAAKVSPLPAGWLQKRDPT